MAYQTAFLGRCRFLCFSFLFLNSLQLGWPATYRWLQRASTAACGHRPSTQILVYCLSLSINHGLTGSENPDSAVNHCTTQDGAGTHRPLANLARHANRRRKWTERQNAWVALATTIWWWRLLSVPKWCNVYWWSQAFDKVIASSHFLKQWLYL